MKYWPLSDIVNALAPGPFAQEWQHANERIPSAAAYHAAIDAAQRLRATEAPCMVLVESINAPSRRVFTDYPEWDEWAKLERICIMEHNGFIFGIVDALH